MTQFVCQDEYRQFRGYVFAWNKPVTVTDRATIEACRQDPSFKEISAAQVPQQDGSPTGYGSVKPNVVPASADSDACPKCGKVFKRGRYFHEKYCKGAK